MPEAIEAAEARARDLEGRGPSREALAVRRDAISLALAADRPRLAAVLFVRMGQGREGAKDTQAAVLAYEGALRALTRDPSLRAGEVVDRLARDPDAGGKGPIPSARPGPSDLYAPLYPGELAAAEAEATLLVKVLVSIGNAYARMPQDAVALGRTVVMSQWSVSDVATAALMEAFYRAYVGGADKATALQRAMREVRAAFPDERHWAPFVVFGADD